jgi:UDP-glucuronate 4-epimerase
MQNKPLTILVTGAAGFIGYHTCLNFLKRGHKVIGIDNLNAYYDPRIKEARLLILEACVNFQFIRNDIAEGFIPLDPCDIVVHLAAQAGVRYSVENPAAYLNSNLVGFHHVLEHCRHFQIPLVYASSSSVYGNGDMQPLSYYAATKRANELMAQSYFNMFNLPAVGLRFFTCYGPWGRPDMALWKWARAIKDDQPVVLYNDGKMKRDWTYVDDVTNAIGAACHRARTTPGHEVYDVGQGKPVEIGHAVQLIAQFMDKPFTVEFQPMQLGDVTETCANPKRQLTKCETTIEVGLEKFIKWFRRYA